jgi:replication initiation and membrane attachment protein
LFEVPRKNAADHKQAAKKIIREEKLPSWAEKPVEETALTPERQAELDKKLQNYLHKKAGDK